MRQANRAAKRSFALPDLDGRELDEEHYLGRDRMDHNGDLVITHGGIPVSQLSDELMAAEKWGNKRKGWGMYHAGINGGNHAGIMLYHGGNKGPGRWHYVGFLYSIYMPARASEFNVEFDCVQASVLRISFCCTDDISWLMFGFFVLLPLFR